MVRVEIAEGKQYDVGKVDVAGDPSIDLDALRERVRLKQGEVFNRSSLTSDVEDLERYYTDRGFFYASVSPRTELEGRPDRRRHLRRAEGRAALHPRDRRHRATRSTRDPVVRREMRVVEGQLYSARSVNRSRDRVKRLGFFEDVEFEAKLHRLSGAARPRRQGGRAPDRVRCPSASASRRRTAWSSPAPCRQANLFGRGYGVNAVIDYGSSNSRFYLSLFDPYLFGSEWSLRSTLFRTDVEYIDFQQTETGVDFALGHDLNEEGTSRGTSATATPRATSTGSPPRTPRR